MTVSRSIIDRAIRAIVANELPPLELEYETEHGRTGQCTLRVYEEADATVLVCTEQSGNPGMSITNAAPAPWLAAEDEVSLGQDVVWIEHYGPESDSRHEHVFDMVSADASGVPRWKRLASVPVSAVA